MCNKKGRINMELEKLLSSMTTEELTSARQKVKEEIERRREGERLCLETELKRLMERIRKSGFHVEIDMGGIYCCDDQWEKISVER